MQDFGIKFGKIICLPGQILYLGKFWSSIYKLKLAQADQKKTEFRVFLLFWKFLSLAFTGFSLIWKFMWLSVSLVKSYLGNFWFSSYAPKWTQSGPKEARKVFFIILENLALLFAGFFLEWNFIMVMFLSDENSFQILRFQLTSLEYELEFHFKNMI